MWAWLQNEWKSNFKQIIQDCFLKNISDIWWKGDGLVGKHSWQYKFLDGNMKLFQTFLFSEYGYLDVIKIIFRLIFKT